MRRGNIAFDDSARQRVAIAIGRVAIARLRESPEVVALVYNHHRKLSSPPLLRELDEDRFYVVYLLLQHMVKLSLRHSVAEVVDVVKRAPSTNSQHPFADQGSQHDFNVCTVNNLNTIAIAFACSSVARSILVSRD